MTETPDTTKTQSAVDTLFEATQKNYSILESLKVGLLSNLFTGFHGRTGPKRIAKMRKAKPAKALTSELAALSAIEANHFLALATANKEQAEAAFRYTAIVNFTAPITFIVLLNQILPGGVIEVVSAYLDLDTFGLTADLAVHPGRHIPNRARLSGHEQCPRHLSSLNDRGCAARGQFHV